MPRTCVHFKNGTLFEDEEGKVFSDAGLALHRAGRLALELAQQAMPISYLKSRSRDGVTDDGRLNGAAPHQSCLRCPGAAIAASIASLPMVFYVGYRTELVYPHRQPANLGQYGNRALCCRLGMGWAMMRYYFHYQSNKLLEDEEGQAFANPDLALCHGRQLAIELAQGGELPGSFIVVATETDQLFEIPLPNWTH
jgi:uncharacterized protein DUF6894